jgi:YHS domain-containing protein
MNYSEYLHVEFAFQSYPINKEKRCIAIWHLKNEEKEGRQVIEWIVNNRLLLFSVGLFRLSSKKMRKSILRKGGEIMAQDPVCKMTVVETAPAATTEYKGKTYYFCSTGCKARFEKEPDKYITESSTHEHSHS